MDSDYSRLLREVEEEVDGYNEAVYDVIAQDLENMTDDLSDDYYFTLDVRSGDAAQDVYDWVWKNKPEVLQGWIEDPEMVMGHDAVWSALEAMKKVEPWSNFTEEDALGMDIRDYERWKASEGPRESRAFFGSGSLMFEGIASVRKNYLETGKITQGAFDAIQEADPTEKKKYMDWMAKVVVSRQPKAEGNSQEYFVNAELGKLVKEYDVALNKNLLPKEKRDIYQLDVDMLVSTVLAVRNKETKTQQRKRVKGAGADKILDDDAFMVYEIHNYDASEKYGKGTKWCISGNGYRDKYWNSYSADGKYFYFVFLKTDVWMTEDLEDLEQPEGEDTERDEDVEFFGSRHNKFAMVFSDGSLESVFDDEDLEISFDAAVWLEVTLINRGAGFADAQPSEVEYSEEEDEAEAQERRYDEWYHESFVLLQSELNRNWSNADKSMELDDGISLVFTDAYLKALEDDPREVARNVLDTAREWADGADEMEDGSEKSAARSLSSQFDEAGYEDGGYLDISDDAMIYVLNSMDYLEPETTNVDMQRMANFLGKEPLDNYQVDSDSWDVLRDYLSNSEYSDIASAKARSMEPRELVAAAEKAIAKWSEDEGGNVAGQKKFAFAEERRLMVEMFELL